MGIGEAAPRLSWATATDVAGRRQAGYEIEVSSPGGEPSSSGRIESDASVLVAWPAAPLGSRQRRTVRVRVWGGDGHDDADVSEWSVPVTFETGLLGAGAHRWTHELDDDTRDDTGSDTEAEGS